MNKNFTGLFRRMPIHSMSYRRMPFLLILIRWILNRQLLDGILQNVNSQNTVFSNAYLPNANSLSARIVNFCSLWYIYIYIYIYILQITGETLSKEIAFGELAFDESAFCELAFANRNSTNRNSTNWYFTKSANMTKAVIWSDNNFHSTCRSLLSKAVKHYATRLQNRKTMNLKSFQSIFTIFGHIEGNSNVHQKSPLCLKTHQESVRKMVTKIQIAVNILIFNKFFF